MNASTFLYLGVKGSVVALDKASGQRIWETELKGSDFVNVVCDGNLIFAHTRGELYCLNALSGELLWKNELSGLGYGLATFASASMNNGQFATIVSERMRQEAAAQSANSNSTTT